MNAGKKLVGALSLGFGRKKNTSIEQLEVKNESKTPGDTKSQEVIERQINSKSN